MRPIAKAGPVATPFETQTLADLSDFIPGVLIAKGARRGRTSKRDVEGQPMVVARLAGSGVGNDVPWRCTALGVETLLLEERPQRRGHEDRKAALFALR